MESFRKHRPENAGEMESAPHSRTPGVKDVKHYLRYFHIDVYLILYLLITLLQSVVQVSAFWLSSNKFSNIIQYNILYVKGTTFKLITQL